MSGYPPGGHYDDGYGHPHGDSYYQDGGHDQAYYDPNDYGDSYYDQSYVPPYLPAFSGSSGTERILTMYLVVDITRPRAMATRLGTTMATKTTTVTSTTKGMATRAMADKVDAVTIRRMSPKRLVTSP